MNAEEQFEVVVAGCGIAGLSAAVSAAQHGKKVAVLERAPFEERGGNTRYTEAFLRTKNESEINDDFVEHLVSNAGGHLDPSIVAETSSAYATWPPIIKSMSFADPEIIHTFSSNVPPTIAWLKSFGIRFGALPTPFLTPSGPRLMPIGGGLAMIEALAAEAERLGVAFFYETTAQDLLQDDEGCVTGIRATIKGRRTDFKAASVVLACGGFEGNPEMLTQYFGERALYLRPFARGANYNKGEGLRMALRIGAAPCGEYGSYHSQLIDPRSGKTGPSVLIFPYGILVNQAGVRFTDEAPGIVSESSDNIARRIPHQPGGIAFAIVDAKVEDIPNRQRSLKTDQPAIMAESIATLAAKLDIPTTSLERSVAAYNAACRPGTFSPFELDGLCTHGLEPRKSNFARPIDKAPFSAYPVVSANVFTLGGLKVNSAARVLNNDGVEIPGLYAAGETVGLYYKEYTGATSVLRGAVFGRLAGLDSAGRRAIAE